MTANWGGGVEKKIEINKIVNENESKNLRMKKSEGTGGLKSCGETGFSRYGEKPLNWLK